MLHNVTTSVTIDLTGWTMSRVLGNQQQSISGTLGPGEQCIFSGAAANIWNNSQRDGDVLYTPDGELVNYLFDQ